MPRASIRPRVGRSPNRPQKLAGTRTDPPESVPSATIAGAARYGRSRSARGAAGDTLRRSRVEGRAVEAVDAEEPERDLVSDRFTNERSAGIQQGLDGRGRAFGGRMGRRPIRITAPGDKPLDVEQILGGEGQPVQWASRTPGQVNIDARHKGPEGIGHRVAFGGPWRSEGARARPSLSITLCTACESPDGRGTNTQTRAHPSASRSRRTEYKVECAAGRSSRYRPSC